MLPRTACLAVVLATAAADAAPWSFELPDGYTEVPGAAEQWAKNEHYPGTVSFDAQTYVSPARDVTLTRLSYVMDLKKPVTRGVVADLDRSIVEAEATTVTKHVGDGREFVGQQLISDATDERDGVRAHQHRIYSLDSAGLVHVLHLICMGPADKLGACEHAQKTMSIMLPDEAKLPGEPAAQRQGRSLGSWIGELALVALVVGLAIWIYESARRGHRRRRRRRH